MIKKFISVVLSVLLLASVFTGAAYAGETAVTVLGTTAVTVKDGLTYGGVSAQKWARIAFALYDFSDCIPYLYAADSITFTASRQYSSQNIYGLILDALDDSREQYVNTDLTRETAYGSYAMGSGGYRLAKKDDLTGVASVTLSIDKDALITALETGDNGVIAVRFDSDSGSNSEVAYHNFTINYDDETYMQTIAESLEWSYISEQPENEISQNLTLPSRFCGCDVSWSSNSSAINTQTGIVTGANSNREVTLTASLSHNGKTAQKKFNVVVSPLPEKVQTVTVPFTNYGGGRLGEPLYVQMNRFIAGGSNWAAVAQLDLTGYEEILRNPGTSLKFTLYSELNIDNGNLSDYTVYLAPDKSDVYVSGETSYEIVQMLGTFDKTRPVLAADNDGVTTNAAGTPVTVEASLKNLVSVLDEPGSENSIVTLYLAPAAYSTMDMRFGGLTISYLESEVKDCIINTPVITIDGNSVSAEFFSCNFTGKEKSYTNLLAVYSADGKLLELADPVYVEADGKDVTTLSASYKDGNVAKAFVWDNMKDINPILAVARKCEIQDDSLTSADISGLMVLTDSSRISEIRNSANPLITQWKNKAISDANYALTQGVYDYSKYSTGEMRNIPESMNRVMSLGMAYLLTADTKYSDRAYMEVNEFLKMADWNKESFLDIAEISTIVSIAYDWMYSAWTQTQKDAIITKLLEAIEYTNKLYKGELPDPNGWIGCTNNWNAVCNGAMAIASMVAMDSNRALCTDVLVRALSELKYVLKEFAPYGGWEEGPSYWAYTMKYLTALASTLNNVYDTDFGIGDTVGLEDSLMLSVSLEGKTATMNIGDTAPSHIYVPEMFYWAAYYENSDVNGAALWTLDTFDFSPDVFTLIYYNPLYSTSFEKPSALYFKGTETVTLESGSAKDDSFIGISGGDAITSHGHLDSGSVIVDMKGERFISDIGAEHYGKDGYFSTKRYLYYRARPEGHNIFVINPSDESEGNSIYYGQSTTAYSEITSFDASKKEAVLDLTSAYSRDVSKASRKISLVGSDIEIEDAITMKKNGEIHWYFHTDASVSVSGNTATLTKNGKIISVTFNPGQNVGSLSLVPAERFNKTTQVTDSENSSMQKLDFKIENVTGLVNIKITLAG